jgi:DNA-3-methyladenine glycosylase II
MPRIIETEADIAEGATALAGACEHMAGVYAVTGPPPLRRRPSGFAGLARIITGQQLSVASAGAIWGRVEKAVRPIEPDSWLRKRAPTLRKCGLSAGKVATIGTIAEAISSDALDLHALAGADEETIKAQLTALKGVGPWTADIYIMFCLGRADGWAPGDLALRYAVQDATGADEMPSFLAMEEIAEKWRPWRGVAARMLWAYYAVRRAQKSADPVG